MTRCIEREITPYVGAHQTRIALRGLEDKALPFSTTTTVVAINGDNLDLQSVTDEAVSVKDAGRLEEVPGLREALNALDGVLHRHFDGKFGLTENGREFDERGNDVA